MCVDVFELEERVFCVKFFNVFKNLIFKDVKWGCCNIFYVGDESDVEKG